MPFLIKGAGPPIGSRELYFCPISDFPVRIEMSPPNEIAAIPALVIFLFGI